MEAWKGLSEEEVATLQQHYGKNYIRTVKINRFSRLLLNIVGEPMFLLLVAASSLYFILGQLAEGYMMVAAIGFVAVISLYQEVKSSKALEALQQLTEPKVTVLRNSQEAVIPAQELVPGDILILEEGEKVPADALIVQQNDLSVNESIITGESLPVYKQVQQNNILYQGTTLNSGKCYAKVTATGSSTVLGKLGKSVAAYAPAKTKLQLQVSALVQKLAFFGLVAFLLIFAINYFQSYHIVTSLLAGLTLAMAAIPEEIPVAFSSFMALGAYYLSKRGIIIRQHQIIEYLGAMSVICLDKTGTITENKMQVVNIYDFVQDALFNLQEDNTNEHTAIMRFAVLASEHEPFDAMEKAIWTFYLQHDRAEKVSLSMIHEYPLQGSPPMMTHVYESDSGAIVAAKGAPETIMRVCRLDEVSVQKVTKLILQMAAKGQRVLGVASALHQGKEMPDHQDDFNWKFEGLISFYDPPKQNISKVLQQLYKAGISVKMVTGDHAETALNISEQVGLQHPAGYVTGEQVLQMDDATLQASVKNIHIFARMFPEAKLKVVEALKTNGETVAMSGDGVNDGPAIRAAHIGIAMGKRGTELARQAADLVLTDDNLEKIIEAVAQGRKILSNLKKAIRYIISIHIPIILTAALPLMFGWLYPNIFSPIHIIFLELIMGPTCSLFYEKEPVEENLMNENGKKRFKGLFQRSEILISIFQGLAITSGVLLLYYIFMSQYSLALTRTIVFSSLICSNVFLTFTNRSFTENITRTIHYRNQLAVPIVVISVLFLVLILLVPALRSLFGLVPLTLLQFSIGAGVALCCVAWFEWYKTYFRKVL
jgi:Ca2+-transporting ATPase